jgi:hypothetical protein
MKAEVYGLASDAVAAVRHALQEQKDARIGYRLLMDIGAIPLPAEAQADTVQVRQPEPKEPYRAGLDRAKRGGPAARVSFGVLGRDVVLQVLDSFFLLRDNPLHQVTD